MKKVMVPESLDGWTVLEVWHFSESLPSEKSSNHKLKKNITGSFCQYFPGTEENVDLKKIISAFSKVGTE